MASNTIIQCSSSSSQAMRTYDVFVSFHGETRNNFTGFLFEALRRKGIDAFKDDKDVRKGESIAPELLQAIAGSRIFIVVFSKDYASSTWCLRELTEICNCIRTSQRSVLPIFYEVNPSEVRKQGGCYEEAFAEHEKRFREDKEKMEEVNRWREALTQVANLSGWDIQNKAQYAEIEEIVQEITNILGPKFSSLPNDNLVGMESRLEELANLLHMESVNNVRVVGISGMGGIGKTTLARALYERIYHQYDFRCYIDDVSKIYRGSGTLGVQKQLLSQSLDERNLEICNVSKGTCLVWTSLRHVRALIILDNVDQVGQLKMFTGSRDNLLCECLGGGSKIIIISRDEHILRTHGVDSIYQVQPLNHKDAVQLFCNKAFKSNYIMGDYQELTDDILSHAQGHPLAIDVLGSSLFGRDVLQWTSALARLRENKSKNIMDVLRISFDELEDTEKDIFLDIACFFSFISSERDVKEILDFRGFHPEYGLRVLADKSLIDLMDGFVYMHSLLSDLGKCIVREKSPKKPRKWSRLWNYKDLYKVMSDNMAAENVEAIVINDVDNFPLPTIRADALSKMSHLKLFKLYTTNFSGRLNNLPNELGYLTIHEYPFDCLPPSFEPDKLVELILRYSNIKQLWEGTKHLHNLRRLNLSHSQNLIEMPDIIEAPNLERLDLQGCIQLRQIHPSIGLLKKLTYLNLKDCKNLVSLPNSILGLNSLEFFSLHRCSQLYSILEEPRNAEHLKMFCIGEAPIHSQSTSSNSIEHKNSVRFLFPSSKIFPCMCDLDLSFCNIVQIPDAIGSLCCLESLDLSGNNFATLPNLKELSRLYRLNLQHCKQLKYLPELSSRIYLPSPTYTMPGAQTLPDGGLYIFNCPELVERERCISMGFSWMIQIVKAHDLYKLLDEPVMKYVIIQSVTPGTEIPRWFNNQHVSMDNNLIIDASQVMHDKNWIGVVCCAVIVVHNETGLAMGPSKSSFFHLNIPVNFYGDLELVSDESDHMWLLFFHRRNFMQQSCLLRTPYLDNLIRITYGRPAFHVEVKKYGYRWLYKQDLELSNLTMMQGRNSSAQKRKFLVIEQNEGRNQGKRRKARISAKQRKEAANNSIEGTIKLLQNQFANLCL